MTTLLICSKLHNLKSKDYNKLEIKDESPTVEHVQKLVASQLNESNIQLICFGRQLNPEKKLSFYGIKTGTIIYVLKKARFTEAMTESKECANKLPEDVAETRRTMFSLRTALSSPAFRKMLDKLNQKEFRDNLIACTPGLKEDPVAIALLQDPELLNLLTDPVYTQKIVEKHPSIYEAATQLAAAFHEEQILPVSSQPSSSSTDRMSQISMPDGYAMYDLSDDEDNESGSAGVDAAPPDGQHVMSPQTANSYRQLLQQTLAARSNQSGASTSGQGAITGEMLRQAISSSNAPATGSPRMNAVPRPAVQPPTPAPVVQASTRPVPVSAPSPTSRSVAPNWARQLQQMHEVGITDDSLSIQVLEAMNGDVQAAINFIFAG